MNITSFSEIFHYARSDNRSKIFNGTQLLHLKVTSFYTQKSIATIQLHSFNGKILLRLCLNDVIYNGF